MARHDSIYAKPGSQRNAEAARDHFILFRICLHQTPGLAKSLIEHLNSNLSPLI